MWRTLFIIGLIALVAVRGTTEDIRCSDRPTYVDQPWIHPELSCLEEVINDPSAGELGFTALAAAPDGTLYAARPLTGEVLALTDTDGDLLPDSPHVIASGLTLPNGLAYHDGALYVAGANHVYRWQDDVLDTLVDDVPAGGGFWTGGIAVRDRIYVSTGAPCDFCDSEVPARGAILSYALDGSDPHVLATGLRFPADLAFFGADLYVVDSARDGLFDQPDLDELNRVSESADFGFPTCSGMDNEPDGEGVGCVGMTSPVLTFPTASTPLGLIAYESDTLPMLTGSLLVVLSGSHNDLDLRGYMLAAVRFDAMGAQSEPIMPYQTSPSARLEYDVFTVEQMNYRGSGFFPHRPLDVAVSVQGWVYVSVGGGRILALRPDELSQG